MSSSIIAQIKKKTTDPTQATIIIRGFYNRKPVASVSLGQTISTDQWDPVKRLLQPSAPSATLINTLIQTKLQQMKNDLLKKQLMGGTVNRQQVVKAVKNIDDSKDFFRFCWQQICLYDRKETIRSYNGEVTKIKQFQQEVSFADIDYNFLTRYRTYMQRTLKNQPNTIWKSFKFISTMINKAIKSGGIIDRSPFIEFDRGKYTQGKRKWLELSDCDRIENKLPEITDDLTYRVALYFLMMAYSGMRFSDAMRFDPALHVDGGRLVMQYQKFDTTVNNKMTDRLKRIVETIKTNRLSTSNKTFNLHLKIIGGMCNINSGISSHVGRHTMGGLLAEINIPEEQAMIILGHKDIRATRVYYHVKNKNLDEAMDRLNEL